MGHGPLLHRVRERIRPLVPRRLQVAANRAVFSVVGLVLRGEAVRCPCCGHSYRRFVRYPTEYCPACGSYERQRLLCLYLDRHVTLVTGDVLQVGPERSIKNRYRPRARKWLAVDANPAHPLADETMDVRSLTLPDEAFDLVLCSHVLDIVDEHDEAVAELHRVTRPRGTVLIQAPWRSVKGMPDVYARRLEGAGFRVTAQLIEEQTDEAARRRFGLDSGDPLFVCRR
jgi:SAM-dependent methyltransferase